VSVKIEDNIKGLKRVEARIEFKKDLREDLMRRVELRKPEKAGGFWSFNIFNFRILKHAYVPVALGVFMLVSSSFLAVKAAGDSLPGDLLYQVKMASEKAQVGFALSQTSKVQKEVDFAGKRLEELNKLTGAVDSQEDNSDQEEEKKELESEAIAGAVHSFNKEISKVKNRLDNLDKNQDDKAVEVARVFDGKAGEFATALNQVAEKEDLPDEIKDKIIIAINALDEVASQVLGVMIKDQEGIEGLEREELVKRLEEKILATETRVASVDEIVAGKGLLDDEQGILLSITKKVELARVILNEARECLADERDLEMVLRKVNESNDLASEVTTELAKEDDDEDVIVDVVDGDEELDDDNGDDVDDEQAELDSDGDVVDDGDGEEGEEDRAELDDEQAELDSDNEE